MKLLVLLWVIVIYEQIEMMIACIKKSKSAHSEIQQILLQESLDNQTVISILNGILGSILLSLVQTYSNNLFSYSLLLISGFIVISVIVNLIDSVFDKIWLNHEMNNYKYDYNRHMKQLKEMRDK